MNRTAFSVGVALVFGLSAFALGIPTAQAGPLSVVKLDCHGPATFTATGTWVWTDANGVISRHTLSCSDHGVDGSFPFRPAGATGFEFTAVLTDSASGQTKTCPTVLESVDPAHAFRYTDSFNMGDPMALHVHVRA